MRLVGEVLVVDDLVDRPQLGALDHTFDPIVALRFGGCDVGGEITEVVRSDVEEADREDLPRVIHTNGVQHPRGHTEASIRIPRSPKVLETAAVA